MSSSLLALFWDTFIHYPTNGPVLNFWILVGVVFYCLAIYLKRRVSGEPIADGRFIWEMTSNAFSFVISICLVVGFVDHNIIVLLGDLSGFLTIFGFVGFYYSLHFLFKPREMQAPTAP